MSSNEKPVLANHDYPFFDSHEDTDIDNGEKGKYIVGTNAIGVTGPIKKRFVSKETLIRANQNILIRINDSRARQATFYANVYYTVRSNVWAIYWEGTADNTLLELKFDGVLPEDARPVEG